MYCAYTIGQSLTLIDTKVESKKLMQNFRASVDAVLFSGCETVNMDCSCQNSELKIMISFWSLWKMFCDFQVEMKLENDQRVVAIIPDDSDILDDVRMGGFKHQFQLVSRSCALACQCPMVECCLKRLFCDLKRLEFRISTQIHVRDMFTLVTTVLGELATLDLAKLCKTSLGNLTFFE